MHVGKKLFLHGDGNNTRKYLYGQDAADAFDTIFHKGEIGQIYNVGSEDEVRNIDVCLKVLDLFGLDTRADYIANVEHSRDRPFNDFRYAVNGDKLKALGWRQKVPFEEGILKTVYWYTKFGTEWWGRDVTDCCQAFPEPTTGKENNKSWETVRLENLRIKNGPGNDQSAKGDDIVLQSRVVLANSPGRTGLELVNIIS